MCVSVCLCIFFWDQAGIPVLYLINLKQSCCSSNKRVQILTIQNQELNVFRCTGETELVSLSLQTLPTCYPDMEPSLSIQAYLKQSCFPSLSDFSLLNIKNAGTKHLQINSLNTHYPYTRAEWIWMHFWDRAGTHYSLSFPYEARCRNQIYSHNTVFLLSQLLPLELREMNRFEYIFLVGAIVPHLPAHCVKCKTKKPPYNLLSFTVWTTQALPLRSQVPNRHWDNEGCLCCY